MDQKNNRMEEALIYFNKKKVLYFMALPGLLLLFTFKYLPMFGIVLAFKDYTYVKGIFGSDWVGFDNFKFFFFSNSGINAIKNTLVLNFVFILTHTFAQVTMALIFNEIKNGKFKKTTQTMMLFPHFISWMIISVFAYNLLNYEYGSINTVLKSFGRNPLDFYGSPEIWPMILTFTDSWKSLGYGMIIYLAVLTGIDPTYYEAAIVDGANKAQQIRFITIPLLLPTITILMLLAVGHILNADFGMFFGLIGVKNFLLFEATDVLDIFVYRNLVELGDIGMSAAAGFFQSVVGFLLILGSNLAARKYQADGALF